MRSDARVVDLIDLRPGRWVLVAVCRHCALVRLRRHLDAAPWTVDSREAVEAVEVNEPLLLAAEIPDERRHVAEPRVSLADREPVEKLPVDREDVAAVRESSLINGPAQSSS